MIQLNETINRIKGDLDTKEWVKCPLCQEDWNKLHPCSYLQDGKTAGTYLCVTCAESIQSVERVFEIMGLDVAIYSKRRKKPYDELQRTYADEFDNPRTFKCTIENKFPIITIDIEPEDTRLSLTHLESKSMTRFSNIFQCTSYFKYLTEQEILKPKEEKKGWGQDEG